MNEHIYRTPTARACLELHGPILFFGGPYSNLEATKALLAEANKLAIPPENIICTGDLAAYCANPSETIGIIRTAGISAIAGNCDIQLAGNADDCGCAFPAGSACERLSAEWFDFARRAVTDDDRTWLATLPRRIDLAVSGVKLAVTHGSLTQVNQFIFASTPDQIKKDQLDLAPDCHGIIAGHSGLPFTQIIDGRLWHNAGVIGLPANDGTPRVWFSILTPPKEPGLPFTIAHRSLRYDHQAATARMQSSALPDGYAMALSSGHWPSCDSLPYAEQRQTGAHLPEAELDWLPPENLVSAVGRRVARTSHVAWPPADIELANRLAPGKFSDPSVTADGKLRAHVDLVKLETLWFNTGTLCNIACRNCYIESSPSNDNLVYITRSEVAAYLEEIRDQTLETSEIAFTGGEPFMNPEMLDIIEDCLTGGHRVLVLTNAMRPMQRFKKQLKTLHDRFPNSLFFRISFDHYTKARHEEERGLDTFDPALQGMTWLSQEGFNIAVAGRTMWGESIEDERNGYAAFFAVNDIDVDAHDPSALVLFPEMDAAADVPEITTDCWNILGKSPDDIMCATSRMVVKRKGDTHPVVLPCTLLPYDKEFQLGNTLADADKSVSLNHPHCAKFCVLGGASCTAK